MKKEQVIYAIIIVVSIISIVVPLIKELHRESLPLEISTNEMPLAKLAFSRKIVDLGEVPEDTILVAKYMLYNTSENLLEIEYVNPDCSCTDYKLSKHSIHPKDSALLTLFLNTANKIGSYELNTILKANTIEKMYMVQMKAKIKENIK
jgi:hypothetical protein